MGVVFLDESSYSDKRAYGQSKLANILHAKELSRRLQVILEVKILFGNNQKGSSSFWKHLFYIKNYEIFHIILKVYMFCLSLTLLKLCLPIKYDFQILQIKVFSEM